MKVDTNIYLPPLITVPERGKSYIDPIFGETILRLSDAALTEDWLYGDGRPCWAVQTEYSSVTPFNSDDTLMFAIHGSSGFVIYEVATGKFFTPKGVSANQEPRWDSYDPNIFYYQRGNEIIKYYVLIKESEVWYKFHEYVEFDNKGQRGISGRGEQDISPDGEFVFCGLLPNGTKDIFKFNLFTRKKSKVLNTTKNFDNMYVTPKGNITVAWNTPGIDRFNGEELFDGNMNFIRQLAGAIGHKDVGIDASGKEVLVWASGGNPISAGGQKCSPTGVEVIDIETGSKRCILPLNWDMALHVHCAPGDPGWAIVSTYSPIKLGTNVSMRPPWAPYSWELLRVKMDGTEVQRLVHTRSEPFTYTHSPRATSNRKGDLIVFNSCMAANINPLDLTTKPNYVDIYMLQLKTEVQIPPIEPKEEENPWTILDYAPYFKEGWEYKWEPLADGAIKIYERRKK